MIKKIIVITFILFVCYSVFVVSIAPKWWHATQHQWQGNIIKAQNFIYNNTDSFDNVIVGSSLSCRLVMDSFPNTYNLAFQGQSIYDGLSLIIHKKTIMKNIFIEMNVALKDENRDFTSALNLPIQYYSKKLLPALRQDRQPLGVIGHQIDFWFTNRLVEKIKSVFKLNTEKDKSTMNDQLFAKLLKNQIENYSKMPNQEIMNNRFSKLKSYISTLENKGVNIVFFEMPVNSQLYNMPGITFIRSAFYKNFPVSKYSYIPIPDSQGDYKTTDGVHLNEEEALKYTMYLRSKMKNYLQ